MNVSITSYHRLAKLVGALLTCMGLGLIGMFAWLAATGANPLAGSSLPLDAPGLLIAASMGAFALPLGFSLFRPDRSISARVRIAAGALGIMALLRLSAFASTEMRATFGLVPLVEFFVLGLIAAAAYFLRPENEPAIEFRTQVELDVPAEVAWQVLGEEFGSFGDWTSGLISSSLDGEMAAGVQRTCEVRGFGPFPPGRIVEEVHEFDRENMKLSYSPTSGMPPMFKGASSRWSIETLGPGRCRVRNHAELELRWWAFFGAGVLRRGIRSAIDGFVIDMRARLGTSEESGKALDAPAVEASPTP